MTRAARSVFWVIGLGLACWIGLGQGAGSSAFGYEQAPVTNGGVLIGKVTLNGPVPEPRIFPLALYPFGTYCAKNTAITDGHGDVRISEFVVAPDHGMKDVVVAVQGVEKGKPFPPIVINLVAKDCQFLPFVSIVQSAGAFTMTNKDPILHNAQVYQAGRGNLLLTVPNPPHSSGTFTFRFERHQHIYQLICGMHEFMQTWGYAVDNPYYALTDVHGNFRIDGLPPGTYKVIAWRPHFQPIEQTVTIAPKGTASTAFAFDAKTVKRPHYETQKQFRIQQ
ncbi:MAG TPA: carboxypeptidase-like regulatory domain-containing protein [Nitrospiria bacterium]|nr:carboxypeptidase-like regulatory domain-containing protein [Nitrospiria bacterium]